MWVFMSDAFLSIVENRDDQRLMMVRARAPGDIERVFPHAKVSVTPDADYRFRAVLPRRLVAETMSAQVEGIGYDNFKNSVTDNYRHAAYARAWHLMYYFQEDYPCESE